jgi:hypothetical protein
LRITVEKAGAYQAAEVALRARRRAGELLAEMPKNQGGGIAGASSTADSVSVVLDMPKERAEQMSSRWQAIAGIPEEMFDELLL